jgi:hypothetical protein
VRHRLYTKGNTDSDLIVRPRQMLAGLVGEAAAPSMPCPPPSCDVMGMRVARSSTNKTEADQFAGNK